MEHGRVDIHLSHQRVMVPVLLRDELGAPEAGLGDAGAASWDEHGRVVDGDGEGLLEDVWKPEWGWGCGEAEELGVLLLVISIGRGG